jgi:septum formation protein
MVAPLSPPPLALASGSPRRQAFLRAAGVEFSIHVSGVDEEAHLQGTPAAVALKTALAKADEVAARLPKNSLVLAADTMVVMDGRIFNKPVGRDEARWMLGRLAGRTHTVITALALERAGGEALVDAVHTRVTFNPLGAPLIESYLASGEADDKAGAYGIQGLGAEFIAGVQGDLTGVIGLPLGRLRELFAEMTGCDLFAGKSPRQVALSAYPDLAALPPACLEGIPD